MINRKTSDVGFFVPRFLEDKFYGNDRKFPVLFIRKKKEHGEFSSGSFYF
jgi:hypothetical protein